VASKPELNPIHRERIDKTLQLAEGLGARTRTLTGRSIPETVLAYARKHNVTKIVIGKPVRPRWRELLSGSVVDQLIYASGTIDVYVISAQPDSKQPVLPPEWLATCWAWGW
jgi:two-component system sensor histidine kinase KdpD